MSTWSDNGWKAWPILRFDEPLWHVIMNLEIQQHESAVLHSETSRSSHSFKLLRLLVSWATDREKKQSLVSAFDHYTASKMDKKLKLQNNWDLILSKIYTTSSKCVWYWTAQLSSTEWPHPHNAPCPPTEKRNYFYSEWQNLWSPRLHSIPYQQSNSKPRTFRYTPGSWCSWEQKHREWYEWWPCQSHEFYGRVFFATSNSNEHAIVRSFNSHIQWSQVHTVTPNLSGSSGLGAQRLSHACEF